MLFSYPTPIIRCTHCGCGVNLKPTAYKLNDLLANKSKHFLWKCPECFQIIDKEKAESIPFNENWDFSPYLDVIYVEEE